MGSILPSYLTLPQIWIDLLPIPIGAALVSAVAASLLNSKTHSTTTFWERWCVLLAFALLGFVVGDLTGQSREAAVPAAIGAILTLLGAAMVYLLGSHGAKQQVFVSAAVCVLTLSLLFGTNWGSVLRNNAELYKQSAAYRWALEREDQKLKDLRELDSAFRRAPNDPASQKK